GTECWPRPQAADDREATRLLGEHQAGAIEILHVGSTAPRKRIDVLLRTFAAIRVTYPNARLVRVGGPLTPTQMTLSRELGVAHAVVTLPFVSRETLGSIYRRAAIVLQPSEREGFGLPAIEALACRPPV